MFHWDQQEATSVTGLCPFALLFACELVSDCGIDFSEMWRTKCRVGKRDILHRVSSHGLSRSEWLNVLC